jgi:hypothetical protein
MSPFDGYTAVRRCLSGTNYKPLLHVPCVGMYWTKASNDEVAEKDELARVAEATLMARANPELSIVIDNFVELDRGYCSCWGLVDRLYNPKDGSRVVTTLNTLLPQRLRNLTSQDAPGVRVLSAECDDGMVLLISGNSFPTSGEFNDHFTDEIANKQGTLIDLVTGKEVDTNLRKRAEGEKSQSPALLLLDD